VPHMVRCYYVVVEGYGNVAIGVLFGTNPSGLGKTFARAASQRNRSSRRRRLHGSTDAASGVFWYRQLRWAVGTVITYN